MAFDFCVFKTADDVEPTLADFKKMFGLANHEVDSTYGFVRRPDKSFLTVISREAFRRLQDANHPNFGGEDGLNFPKSTPSGPRHS